MSGYLQRLVQTAAQPVQTVHPFAGSIYARGADYQSDGIESEESTIAARPTTAPDAATSQQQHVPEYNSRRDKAPPREYRPIAPVSVATFLPSEGETKALPSWQERPVQPPRPTANVEANDSEQPPAPVFAQTEFHPLMPQDAVVAEPRLASSPFRAETRASHDSRRPTAVERVSDDIQIHIGRIEVTAVHPPAPRAPKAPDRSLSLDAYLNRRAR